MRIDGQVSSVACDRRSVRAALSVTSRGDYYVGDDFNVYCWERGSSRPSHLFSPSFPPRNLSRSIS